VDILAQSGGRGLDALHGSSATVHVSAVDAADVLRCGEVLEAQKATGVSVDP